MKRSKLFSVPGGIIGLTLCALCVCLTVAVAAEPERIYASFFGLEAEKVAATPDTRDDAAFARKLLAAAAEAPDSPGFQVLLYDKAYGFGLKHKDGYAAAEKAATLLGAASPDREAECNQKLLNVYELQYRHAPRDSRTTAGSVLVEHLLSMAEADLAAGKASKAVEHYGRADDVSRQSRLPHTDWIAARTKVAVARRRAQRQIAQWTRVLEASPDNHAAARRLLTLYLVDMDDPNKAAELLPKVGADESLRTYVPLLTRGRGELPETACLELGDWYLALAGEAKAAARPGMLLRAESYYQQYLALHGKRDAQSVKAKMQMKKIEKQLEQFPHARPRPAVGPFSGVSIDIVRWAKQRDALPVGERRGALEKKLREVNGDETIELARPEIDGDRIVHIVAAHQKKLASITPLYGMKLTKLRFHNCPVASLEPLRGMPLVSLRFELCRTLRSLKGIEDMPLTELGLWGCPAVESLEPARGVKLTKLQLDGCASLRDFSPLGSMPLTELSLSGSPITSLAPLRGLKLTKLNLSKCDSLKSIKGLREMPLTDLDLTDLPIPITNLRFLKGLKLKNLVLLDCRSLGSLAGIEDMPLVSLDLRGTKFAKPEVAEALKKRIPTLAIVKLK